MYSPWRGCAGLTACDICMYVVQFTYGEDHNAFAPNPHPPACFEKKSIGFACRHSLVPRLFPNFCCVQFGVQCMTKAGEDSDNEAMYRNMRFTTHYIYSTLLLIFIHCMCWSPRFPHRFYSFCLLLDFCSIQVSLCLGQICLHAASFSGSIVHQSVWYNS